MAIPVLVLTGALGAGKTTLLNRALQTGAIRNAGIIVNEFGAVGIDNALIEASTEDVVLLPGGCVCCQVRADLAEALLRLERGAARGELPAFERVVVETSGLADPNPILQLFAESPLLAGRFRLEALVTVIDAVLGGEELAEEGVAFAQALLADRLVVTKGELAGRDKASLLEERLASLNPSAQIIHAPRGGAEGTWFGPAPFDSSRLSRGGPLRAAHDESVESFVLSWDAPQRLAAIGDWLQALAESQGARLLRVKGIVAVEEDTQAVAVHAIRHLVAPPEFLSMPAGESRVVFITRGLEPGDVQPPWPTAARGAQGRPLPPAASTPTPLPGTGASSGAATRR